MELYPINDIKIGDRRRKDLGDLNRLMASIQEVGLLHPVVITPDGWLIAGERRIEAFRRLGREHIPATVAQDLTEVIAQQQAEIDENACRKDFTPEEAVEKGSEYEPREREAAKKRQEAQDFGRGVTSEKFTEVTRGVALDRVAAAVGMSRPTYKKAKEVVEAAREDPETLGPILDEMNKTGNVTKAYRKLKREQKREALKAANLERIRQGDFNITLHQDDALQRIPLLEDKSVALVVADPPYNVTGHDWDKVGDDADYLEFNRSWLAALKPKLADDYHLYVFCSPTYAAPVEMLLRNEGWPLKSRIIWSHRNLSMGRKASDKYITMWEMCFHVGTHALNLPDEWDDQRFEVKEFAAPQSNFNEGKHHPTAKPVELIAQFVRHGSKPGDVVLDPFAGGGTTGAACAEVGQRRCILIEKEPEYCDVIKQRLGVGGGH